MSDTYLYQNLPLQLYVKRVRVASSAEKMAIQQIDANFMSDEEDGEDSQEGSWVVRSPPWRSPQLSSLLKKLQDKVENQPSASSHPQNTRVEGEPSTHSPPASSPAWALLPGDRERCERSPSPELIPTSPQSPRTSRQSTSDEGDEERWDMLDTSQ